MAEEGDLGERGKKVLIGRMRAWERENAGEGRWGVYTYRSLGSGGLQQEHPLAMCQLG